MKTKLLLLFLLLLLGINSKARQQYKRCLDDGMVRWSVYLNLVEWPGSSELVAYDNVLINNNLYKRIYEYSSFPFDAWEETNEIWKNYVPDFDPSYPAYSNFFIRESEDASKLYILDKNKDKEYLISDMSLQVGDKFQIPEIWEEYSSEDSVFVDSVYIKNGLKHIQLDYKENITIIIN